jgi:putative transposase
MARRRFVPGMSHHVWHRGHNHCRVFLDDGDRVVFLAILGRAIRRLNVRMHGYSLMDTHYHGLVTAPDEDALPRTMQLLGREYVDYFNKRYGRTGTLWQGRYKAAVILDERRWLTCLRYIELNPVEAKMVSAPDAYRWTSYRHHAFGEANPLLSPHPLLGVAGHTPAEQQRDWQRFCRCGTSPEDGALILAALRSNRPIQEPGYPEVDDVDAAATPVITQP